MDRRWGTWMLAALAPVTFLALDPGGWYPFGPAKWLAVSVLVPAGAGALWWRGTVRVEPRVAAAFGVLLGFLVLGALAGLDPVYAWIGTPERELGVLTWGLCGVALVAGQTLDPDRDGGPVRVGLVVAAVGVGAVATAEAAGWAPGPVGLGGDRLTGTFGTAAYLGAASALLLPAVAGIAADRALDRVVRWPAALGSALLVVACVGAGTRSAWLGLAVAAALLGWSRRPLLAGRRPATAALAVLALVGIGVLVVAGPVGDRVSSAFDTGAPGGVGRVDEWRVAARVIADDPLTGTGPEGYRIAFASGVDERYQREHGRDPLPDRAHSAPLDVALAGGIGAALAWLALVVLLARPVRRALRGDRPWVAGLAVGLVAHVVGELFLFPTMELDPVAWLLAGLVVAATARPGELRTWAGPGGAAAEGPEGAGAARRTPRGLAAASASVLVVVACAALLVGAAGVVADRHAAQAASSLGRGDGAGASTAAELATALRPDVLRYHLLEARARMAAGEGTVASLEAVDGGLAVSPDDPIGRLARARYLVTRVAATKVPAHAAAARRSVDRILAGDPLSGEAWLLAGELGRLDGAPRTAERAWLRAERLLPRDARPPTQLALLYLATGRTADAGRAVDRALARDPDDPAAQAAQAEVRRS